MATLIEGHRISKDAKLQPGCSAAIFDATGAKLLLTRRADNGRWCLPGGRVDPGETVAETCIREVWEETGLNVTIDKLVGVYSNPHRIIHYDKGDGARVQLITLHFAVTVTGGTLQYSDETTEFGYFTRAEMDDIDLMEHHVERIEDSYTHATATFIR